MPTVAKFTWVTRRVPVGLELDWTSPQRPGIGDLLLCEVIHPSLHRRIETVDGGRSRIYPGDRIVCAVGNRYASAVLEGTAEIAGEQIELLSASGICGRVLERASGVIRPTSIRVLAQASLAGRPVNLQTFAAPLASVVSHEPAWIVVTGSSMDSGKTTACASLINGLVRAGLRVAAAKLTGTASGRDLGAFRDAGAAAVYDFLDHGWPSTAGCSPCELEQIVEALVGDLRASAADVAVLEIADGLLQPETRAVLLQLGNLLRDPRLIVTAAESLSAVASAERLLRLGYHVAAITGVVTNSPLASREIELECAIQCIPTEELCHHALSLVGIQQYASKTLTLIGIT